MQFPDIAHEWMLAHESLAIFYLDDNELSQASEHIDKAINICISDENMWRLELTRLNIRNSLPLSSILTFKEVYHFEKMDMCQYEDLFEIAKKFYYAEAHIKALKAFESLSKKYPEDVEACLGYSNMLSNLNKKREALNELDRAVPENCHNYKLLCNKGRVLNHLGRFNDAIVILLEAVNMVHMIIVPGIIWEKVIFLRMILKKPMKLTTKQ